MRIKVLGSAAGGGFPQWNCACGNCVAVRQGTLKGAARTQTQLAVTSDGRSWFLLNASPDLRQQILATPELTPAAGPRGSPIIGVALTSADVDAVIGLLHLREFHPLRIYSTPSIRRILTEQNSLFRTLERSKPPAQWRDLPLGQEVVIGMTESSGNPGALRCTAIALGGTYPEYVGSAQSTALPAEDAVIALLVSDGRKKMLFAPGLPGCSDTWKTHARGSDLAFLDSTFWRDDELVDLRASLRTAREMGHAPLSGKGGMLEELQGEKRLRRVAIHINNTNPILDEESAEHQAMIHAGWEIARDGMEFVL
jgi:pyrroloquinoline quinone biosynthesis protein B